MSLPLAAQPWDRWPDGLMFGTLRYNGEFEGRSSTLLLFTDTDPDSPAFGFTFSIDPAKVLAAAVRAEHGRKTLAALPPQCVSDFAACGCAASHA